MFSLRDLHVVLCSRDLDVLRAQRIIGILISITHNSTRSQNPVTWRGKRGCQDSTFYAKFLAFKTMQTLDFGTELTGTDWGYGFTKGLSRPININILQIVERIHNTPPVKASLPSF